MKTRKTQPADLEVLTKAFELQPSDVSVMLPSSVVCLCPSGTAVVREGETGAEVYVALKGGFSVRRSRWMILSQEIARLKPGDLFGEIGFLISEGRTASVVADGPCEVIRIATQELKDLLAKKPELRARVEEEARQRVYALSRKAA